jgi:ferric-dicitrate binding protein FerR (iron transport regulator)
MKRSEREVSEKFDEVVDGIRRERPEAPLVEAAAARVWTRISQEHSVAEAGLAPVERLRGCADFQALIPAYLHGYVSDARALLLEDHTRECVPCRKALKEARASRHAAPAARQPGARPSIWQQPALRWAIAAALIIGCGLITWPLVQRFGRSVGALHTIVQAANGQVHRVSENRTQRAAAGDKVQAGERIRTAKNAKAIVKLGDGSMVEMRERSEISVSENASGTTVNLERGSVIVQAAKQHERHLYVATSDSLVSVKGTIFSVNAGTKGSRVSVIEGEVHVDHAGAKNVLRPGDQVATHDSIGRIPVREEVSWSQDAARYAKTLDELAALRKEIDQKVARPGVRYSTRLLDLVPAGTALYIALPNLSAMLDEANTLLNERIEQSPELREWWAREQEKRQGRHGVNELINQVKAFGSYLGDEIVISATLGEKGEPDAPLVLAEINNPAGFRTYVEGQLARVGGEAKPAVRFIEDPLKAAAAPAQEKKGDLYVWLREDLLVASPRLDQVSRIAGLIPAPEQNGFSASPFRAQIAELYRDGAGLIIAADLQRLLAHRPRAKAGASEESAAAAAAVTQLGLNNLRYFIAEVKEKDGQSSNRALLTFNESPRGITSWLAAPGPMGALEFISPDATAVAAFVVERPISLVEDLLGALRTAQPQAWEDLQRLEAESGINLRDDFAAPLGGEFAFAIDGPLLPLPSWKTVIEVYDQARLQESFTRTVARLNEWAASQGKAGFRLDSATSGERTFYTLKSLDFGVEASFTDAYGYLIAGANRALVERALQYRDSGVTLHASPKFKATLPEDKQANFSAMFYYNLAPSVGPLARQVGQVTRRGTRQLQDLAAMKPALAYAYAHGDRIILSANTEDGPVGLSPSALLGLPGSFGLSQIFRHATP